jgi:hypothetical protein
MSALRSCSNPPPEVAHEPEETKFVALDSEETKVSIPNATWSFSDRVSMSPAHDSLHGLFPLVTSFQFMDRDDEASFVAKDCAAMRPMQLFLIMLEMTVPPYSLTPLGVQSRPLTWPVTVCVVIQLVVRYLDVDSTRGADWYAKFFFATTFLMWTFVVGAQQFFGFAPIASDTLFLVLFFVFVFLQGQLLCSAVVYKTTSLLLFLFIFNAFCTLHLYLVASSSDSPSSELPLEGAHAGPEPLMPPLGFGLLYCFMTLTTVGLVFSQLLARRFHHAELEYMHERLRREKERIGYELAIAQKAQSVAQRAAARFLEDEEGNRKAARSGGGLSASGARSAKSVVSSAMSSHMSDFAAEVTMLRAEEEAKEHEARQQHVRFEPLMAQSQAEKAEERQQKLWTTLAELGIRPKSVASDVSDQALL